MRSLINATDEEIDAAFTREREAIQHYAGHTSLLETHRLILQCLSDKGGESHGFPMWLVPDDVSTELMERVPLFTSGVVSWRITEKGTQALHDANAALGVNATRYVYRLKTFGSLKPIVYGYPFLVPLFQRVWKFSGTLVADKPPLRYRLGFYSAD